SVLRNYSSASTKEKATRNAVCERTELMEVLKARVKQLQASNVPEVTVNKVELTPLGNDRYQDPLQKVVAPGPAEPPPGPRGRNESPAPPPSWVEKSKKEMPPPQLKVERRLSIPPPLDPEAKAKAKPPPKAKAKPKSKTPPPAKSKAKAESKPPPEAKPEQETKVPPPAKKSLKVKELPPPRQRFIGPYGTYIRSKPWVAAVKEPPPLQSAQQVQEDPPPSQYKILQQTIPPPLECFLFLQQPPPPERFLHLYHYSPPPRRLLNVNAYNPPPRSWARKPRFGVAPPCVHSPFLSHPPPPLHRIYQLLSMPPPAGLQPNLDSYAPPLECLGRNPLSYLPLFPPLQQLEKDGFHVPPLFQKCLFEEDDPPQVLKAIRIVQPPPQLPPPASAQTCPPPLLQDFYSREKVVSYPKLDFSVQELQERFQQQLKMELNSTVTIESVESIKPLTPQAIKARKLLDTLRSPPHDSILQALQKSKHSMSKLKMASGYPPLYPYLCLLPEDPPLAIMLQILNTLSPPPESLAVLARELAPPVYDRYVTQRKLCSGQLEKVQDVYTPPIHLLAKDSQLDNYLPRPPREKLVSEAGFGPSLNLKDCSWPYIPPLRLGMHMLELLPPPVKVPRNILNPPPQPKLIPVLYHIPPLRSTWQVGLVKPHPPPSQIVSDAAETPPPFNSSAIPMLCPPPPWTSPHFGAFPPPDTKLMRFVDGPPPHQLLLEQCPPPPPHPVLDALNQLPPPAWKINQPVLDPPPSIFNDKGNEKPPPPPPISEAPKPPPPPSNSSTLSKAPPPELLLCKKKAAPPPSLRMDALYKLSIANYVRDKVFWFPPPMDFRGRTYPCPPPFNHLGNDVTRPPPLFAEGRPLGPPPPDWLKIHLINLPPPKKKNALRERLPPPNEIMEEILDSADHPLTGRKWSPPTDEPWQALACSPPIAKASRSPDPAAYISHFPVHQDGSCNGLQHYAALGRDLIGAVSVNLMPSSVPQDVYSAVAQQPPPFRKKDAEEGVPPPQVLQGFVSRKPPPQTVMTVVYGVTRYGGRLQIEKRLKEIDEFPEEYLWEASPPPVKQVFNGIKEPPPATRDIQVSHFLPLFLLPPPWLTESAKLIAPPPRTVEWVTPLGPPPVQPYYRSKSTPPPIWCILPSPPPPPRKPDTVKQKNPPPPNFIHSLDSTHMMLTALHCLRQGLTFVSVHDCYWTHALTVDIMNQICRQQFVALHSEPPPQDLSEFMLE
ncbi:RPOM protein, partial [Crotophaga sulcirostris]|nr:RPOM protein [Crotophaga sulcirostris]